MMLHDHIEPPQCQLQATAHMTFDWEGGEGRAYQAQLNLTFKLPQVTEHTVNSACGHIGHGP